MFRKMAWLWIAMLMVASPIAKAQAPVRKQPPLGANASPVAKIARDVKAGERPTSMDRRLPPDQYPTNVVKILRTTNKAQTNSYVPVVFTFMHNNPFNVIRFLHRPVQTEDGLLFTFVNPENNGGKVLFVVPDYMVPSLRALIDAIDRPELTTAAGDERVYRQLKHRRADITDPDFLATSESFLTGNGSELLADPEENALYFEDAPSGSQALDQALTDWLDVPTAMLEMIVKIYEIDASNDATVGLDYMAWKNGPGANLFALGAFAEHGSFNRNERAVIDPIGTGARGLPHNNFTASGYNYAFRYDVPSAFFDYLAVKGKARILNSIKLAALNTRDASVSVGDELLYYAVQTSDPSGIRNSGEPFQANGGRTVTGTVNTVNGKGVLTPVKTGIQLDLIRPIIGEQSARLNLKLRWSDYNSFDDTGFPQINQRTLETSIRSKLGDEFIIGGLQRQVVVKSTRKVPILGSIPILGYAFGGETSQTRKSEIIVVIHPTAIFKYDVAKDYKIHASEQEVIDQASGVKPIQEPKADWGFDQLGLDKEKGAVGEDLK